jgi:cold shock CspA family protein
VLLLKSPESSTAEIGHHLRRAFTEGDSNYAAQFWYGRWLYMVGEWSESKRILGRLGKSNIDVRIRQEPRGIVQTDGSPVVFTGVVSKLEDSYGFIVRDEYQDVIFAHKKFSDAEAWRSLKSQMRVRFHMAFTYRGPLAIQVLPESEAK